MRCPTFLFFELGRPNGDFKSRGKEDDFAFFSFFSSFSSESRKQMFDLMFYIWNIEQSRDSLRLEVELVVSYRSFD